MAIVQISRIQHRRGLQQDLGDTTLSSAELGWSVNTRQLWIGNGTISEGAPTEGHTEILTEHSDLLSFINFYTFKGQAAGYTVMTGTDELHPIVRKLQDKLDDIVSVKDFGAKGDGFTDDTAAIQRALDRVFAGNQLTLLENKHRTINFPAGTYIISDTLKLPPFSRLQGEGKNSSVITCARGTSMGKPLLEFADDFGQTGTLIGQADIGTGATPNLAEYHISDMKFLHQNTDCTQPCVVIDACYGAYFNRVQFRGLAHYTTPDLSTYTDYGSEGYDVDLGTGIAGVACNNLSNFESCNNLVFSQCDFIDINYGIEFNNTVTGVSISGSYFNHVYHGVVTGNNSSGGQLTSGVAMFDNYVHYTAAESVYCGVDTRSFVSQANYYDRAGVADYEADVPVTNTSGDVVTPTITFNTDNNFSVGDTFHRVNGDFTFPYIETNNYISYVFGQDQGLINGKLTNAPGLEVTLSNHGTYTSAGLSRIPSTYGQLTVKYRVYNGSIERTGTLVATGYGGTYNYTDDYVETADIGVVLRVNPTTGDVEYTSTGDASFSYSLNYFID